MYLRKVERYHRCHDTVAYCRVSIHPHRSVGSPLHNSVLQGMATLCSQLYPSIATVLPAYECICTSLVMSRSWGSKFFIPI